MAYDIQIVREPQLERLLSTSPDMKKRMQEAIGAILWEARNRASKEIQKYMLDDAREAYRAVHNTLYRKVLGGNINILNPRHALRRGRVSPSWRGRTSNTERIMSYRGPDRGFILRFVNDGTAERWTKNMDGHPMYRKSVSERPKSRTYKYKERLGGRNGAAMVNGRTRNMFVNSGNPAMETAASKFQMLIDKIIIDLLQ